VDEPVAAAGQGEDGAANPPEDPDSKVSQPAPAKATKSKSSIVSFDFGSMHFLPAGAFLFKL
jgi:hypothetical protein